MERYIGDVCCAVRVATGEDREEPREPGCVEVCVRSGVQWTAFDLYPNEVEELIEALLEARMKG